MKILRITNIRDFMNQLLLTELFDHFLLSEATIVTRVTYVIDGHLTKSFFDEDERLQEHLTGLDFAPFSMLRASCCELIKGKKTPVSFKFVFMLSPDNLGKTLDSSDSTLTTEDLSAALINIRFSDGNLTCTSGISYKTFTLDHSFEHDWDALVEKFLSAHQISFEPHSVQ